MTPVAVLHISKVDLELAIGFFHSKFNTGQELQENVSGFG